MSTKSGHASTRHDASIRAPMIWLGQSVDTSALTARLAATRKWPVLTSLGDAMRRDHYIRSHFHAGLRDALGVRGPLMVDSGGFILMMREMRGWNARRVASVYRELDADVLVSLDHPPTAEESLAQRRAKRRKTRDNFRLLHEEFGADRLMPVVHGVTLGEVEESCAAVHAIAPRPRWIGVGGLVPLLRQLGKAAKPSSVALQKHLGQVLAVVRTYFPHAMLHVFGAGAPRSCLAAFAMGADSADSQGWRQAAGYGSIYLPGTAQRILEWKHAHTQPRPLINAEERKLIGACACPSCRPWKRTTDRVAELKRSFEPRAIHNAWVLRNEVQLLRNASSERAVRALLTSRLPKSLLEVTLEARASLQAGLKR